MSYHSGPARISSPQKPGEEIMEVWLEMYRIREGEKVKSGLQNENIRWNEIHKTVELDYL
jgi:hypothetical protein